MTYQPQWRHAIACCEYTIHTVCPCISVSEPSRNSFFSIFVPEQGLGPLQVARPVDAYSTRYGITSTAWQTAD